MNMQSMIKEAKKLQKEVEKTKKEIDESFFTGESGFVSVKTKGTKEIVGIDIKGNIGMEKEDLEMLEDMIVTAINEIFRKIDNEKENKMNKFGPGLSGLM